jgi:hypothetical protein
MASDMILRKASALGLMFLLYMSAIPFDPVAWFIMEDDPILVGQMVQVCGMLGALYFQWSIAGVQTALAFTVPDPTQINANGAYSARLLVWLPRYYWPAALGEAVLLCMAWLTYYEPFRRMLVMGVMAPLWALGWLSTPASTRAWAWRMVKDYWFQMVVSEMLWGGGRQRRRRGRRY